MGHHLPHHARSIPLDPEPCLVDAPSRRPSGESQNVGNRHAGSALGHHGLTPRRRVPLSRHGRFWIPGQPEFGESHHKRRFTAIARY